MLNGLLIAIMILLPFSAALGAKIKIGLINTQKIMRESKAAKRARAVFLKDLATKKAVLRAKQQKVRAMEEEFKVVGKDMTPSVKKKRAEEIAREVKELRRLRSDLEEELKKKDAELTSQLRKEIRDIVKEYLKKYEYTVVLEKRSVVASDDAIDITDEIMKLYDTVK